MDNLRRKQLSIIRALKGIFFLFVLLNHWGCNQSDLQDPILNKHSSTKILDKENYISQKLLRLRRKPPSLLSAKEQVLWQVNGEVLYHDRLYDETGYEGLHTIRSVPHIKVEILRRSSRPNQEAQLISLSQSYTNEQGQFRLAWQGASGKDLRSDQDYILRAYSLQMTPNGHRVEVRSSRQSMPYLLEVTINLEQFSLRTKTQQPWLPKQVMSPGFLSLQAPKEGHLSGAFNILNATALGFKQIANHSDEIAPVLTFTWDLDQAVSCGSCYSNDRIRLGGQVEDPDHYDDHIILHEMGHFFTDRWSIDDSPGGPHRGRAVHPSLAYGEGLAYFWSALVLQDPLIVDWMFPEPWIVDLEQNLFNGAPMTWGTFAPVASTSDLVGVSALHHEELVSSMLWSIYQLFLVETGDWAESILMEALVNELPTRIDNGSDVGAIGIDFADFLDSLICSLSGEVELSQWLEQIEAYSRSRSYSWYWFDSREEFCTQKGSQESLLVQYVHESSDDQTQDIHSRVLIIERLDQIDESHYDQDLSYQVWLGSPPDAKLAAKGTCRSLPCALTLQSLLEQSVKITQQLQKDQPKSTAINQYDLNKLSVPIMITLTQDNKQQRGSDLKQWRGSWLSKTYLSIQKQRLNIVEWQNTHLTRPPQQSSNHQSFKIANKALREKGLIYY